MKIKYLVLPAILFVFVIIMYSVNADYSFLSTLLNKNQNTIVEERYNISLTNQSDSLLTYRIRYHTSTIKETISWLGDTTRSIPALGSGYYAPKEIIKIFSGYDSSIIKITERKIIPLQSGKTKMIGKYPVGSDTTYFNILEKKNKLVIALDQ